MLGGRNRVRHDSAMASFRRITGRRIGWSWGGAWRCAGGFLLLTGAALSLAGCSPVGMAVGAGATVTNMAMEERGFVTSATDKAIWTDITFRMANRNDKMFQNI